MNLIKSFSREKLSLSKTTFVFRDNDINEVQFLKKMISLSRENVCYDEKHKNNLLSLEDK